MERWELHNRKKVAAELAQKLTDFQCAVHDLDDDTKITPKSVEYWANASFDYLEDMGGDEDHPIFTLAELWAVQQLAADISVILNKK